MNERLDAILTEYEELWRQAALEGRGHWAGPAAGGLGEATIENPGGPAPACGWLVADADLQMDAYRLGLGWRCSCGYETTLLSVVIIHLNNAHRWTWDMLANKTRDALAQGMAPDAG